MSDPIHNFELILKNRTTKRPLAIYNDNKQPKKHNLKPQDVISSVSMQLKAIQVADTIIKENVASKDLQKYKTSKFINVNKLPVYDEVIKKPINFDTQCVSDTELINVIEGAEVVDVHQGITQEFETTFCHHTEKQAVSDDKTTAEVCSESNMIINKDIQTVSVETSKEINKVINVSKIEAISEDNCTVADTSMSIISPIMCSNKINEGGASITTQNSIKDYTQVEEFSPILNNCIETEDEAHTSIERPLSPIFVHKHVKMKSKTPSPLIFNLEKFEQFEKTVIPILESNELKAAKHVIDSQILDKELHLNIHQEIELNEKDVLSPLLQNKNAAECSPAHVEFKPNIFKDKDTGLEFIQLDKATSNDLINKVINENVSAKVRVESEILKDEILFSSDEEDSYVHKDYQDLPFTCALETSFYDQSDVLDKTMYVGFQTASNKSIQILTESFAQAKSLLSDVSSNEITVTDLVKNCDSYSKNKSQNDENLEKIVTEYDVKEFEFTQIDHNTSKLKQAVEYPEFKFEGFMTASKKEIKLSEKALARCKKLFEDIDLNEKLEDETETKANNTKSKIDIKNHEELKGTVKEKIDKVGYTQDKIQGAFNESKSETGKSFADDDIQNIDDAIIQEFENIEMSLKEEDILVDIKQGAIGFKTASCKDIKISETALLKVTEVYKDIDFDEDLSEIDMKEVNVKENIVLNPSNTINGNFEGFKTASNKKIHISNEAITKTKNLFQDIGSTEFPNKFNKNLDEFDKPSTSKASFVGFQTVNNRRINISADALQRTENVFKGIDATDFKYPIKRDKRQIDHKVHTNGQLTTGFKTANNKEVIVSKEAITKTKFVFNDIDSTNNKEVIVSKEAITKTKFVFNDIDSTDAENTSQNKSTESEKILDFYEPSTSKTNDMGSKTGINNTINGAAMAITENIFKDIDSTEVSSEAGIKNIEGKNINESETVPFERLMTENSFVGFKTASNMDIKISAAALTETKNIFNDIDNVVFPSKSSKDLQANTEEKITERNDRHIDNIQNIVSNKITTFTGFNTASNKKINISEASLSKSKHIFKDIDSNVEFPDKEERVDSLERKEWRNEYDMADFNQSFTSRVSFVGFRTANNKKINISEKSLAKTRDIFKDIDSNDFVYPKKHTKLQELGNERKDPSSVPSKNSFEGFTTGNNKLITVSETALAKTKNMFKDIVYSEFDLPENTKKDYPYLENDSYQVNQPHINKPNFVGFKTGNNKVIQVSELALSKTKNIFKDIDSTELQLPEKNKKDYPDEEKYIEATDSNVIIKDKSTYVANDATTTDNNVMIPKAVLPKFQGFQTASNKKVEVSADALVKSRKIFQDINIIDGKIDEELELVNSNSYFVNIHKEVNDSEVDNIELPDGKSSPVFKGFQTANKKPVSISKDTLAKSRKLFQDLEDIEPEFRGFKTPTDGSCENDLTQVKSLLEDKIKETMSFQTASDKKVVISEDALAKSRKLFGDFDKDININEKMTPNMKFGFKTGTNCDIVVSEEAISRSKRLFSEIDALNVGRKENKKDKLNEENIANIIDTQVLNNFDQSLHTNDFHDSPVKSKRSGSPILSCPKAKRRKKFEIPYSQKIRKPEIKKDIIPKKDNAITFNETYKKCKKLTLKDLMNKSIDNTTIEPYLLQFNFDTLLQFEFRGTRNDVSSGNMTVSVLKDLFLNSVNSKLVPNGWLDNHLKLILWKLISYEIKFNSCVVCSARNVIDQLKYRYDKELYNAQSPALRKILEKDDVASKTMVLCVARIFIEGVNQSSSTTGTNTELLLTDGWYCIRASLDKMLAQLVSQAKIRVGTKLVTNGAELVNCEQGISPWEDTSAVRLKIFGNSTRRARWDARLGYHGNGAILCQLSSVRLDGGKVSKLRVYVTRVYPALYVEKFEDGSTVTRSERLEHVHQMKSEVERQAIMEKIYEEVEKEFSDQESQDSEGLSGSGNKRTCLDSGSQIAKLMKTSKDPAEFRAELTSSQTRLLEDHTTKRRERLLQDIQERIRDKVEKAGVGVNRNVVTLLKIRVAGVSGKSGLEVTKGMMSIWKPTDAVLEIIKEGAWIDIMNVVPTAVRYSELQISAGRQSIFNISKHKEPEQFKPCTKLLNRNCFTIKDLAHNSSMTTDYNEVDTVGFIFLIDPSIQEFDSTKQPFQNVFLADADKNIICINFWGGLNKFGFQNVLDTGQIVTCVNLQKRAGNTRKSIPQYRVTEFSYFTKTPKNENARILLDELCKKFLSLDRRKFCEDCVVLKNNYSVVKHNIENVSPYRLNNSDYNISKHKMFIDSPLVRPNKIDDNFNLTGLDFESTFKQTDTQNLPEEVLLRKKKVNEKIARLKMYGEPPPLSTIHIINKSKNASSSYKSPLISNNNNSKIFYHNSKNENKKPPNSESDSYTNVANFKNTPEKYANLNDVTCSPVFMNRTYVKSVNPVKINFEVQDNNDSIVDHFAEEFDASPPLSLD